MNYKLIYDSIINKRLDSHPNGYHENHHITPRCLGGDDEPTNIVALTAREHYICHLLLVKIHQNNKHYYHKMLYAYMMMVNGRNDKQVRDYKCNSRIYESLRKDYSKFMSLNQSDIGNNQYGTKWFSNYELRVSKRFLIDAHIPNGWVEGRIMNWEFLDRCCIDCGSHLKLNNSCNIKKCDSCRFINSRKLPNNAKKKSCVAYGIEYSSIQEAAIANNISHETMRLRCQSNHNNDCYIISV